MTHSTLSAKAKKYLNTLCVDINDRSVGSEGNRRATRFFSDELAALGWDVSAQSFDAVDWKEGGAVLKIRDRVFNVQVSPYSTGCSFNAPLAVVSNIAELERGDLKGRIVLLHGEIAREQLMPKNFVFYNPEIHQKIISLLEGSGALALVCATGKNAALAGGVYPFPLIEDGDFELPSVYMTEEEGKRLIEYAGMDASIRSVSERIPGKGYNVVGKNGKDTERRIVITAHIDSKKGTPGAIDNATGVVVLLLLAGLLKDNPGAGQIEVVAFNGEDYYSVPGQMAYIMANRNKFDTIAFNINIDGAGYIDGKTTFSLFDLPGDLHAKTLEIINKYEGITEGVQWPQGDHSIFLQYGRPALAVSSQFLIDNFDSHDITHTPRDNPDIVNADKLVEISLALNDLIRNYG